LSVSTLIPAAPLEVSLSADFDLARLEREWLDLERRARASFFLSWSWIGAWLRSLPDAPAGLRLLAAQRDGRTVGLALLGARRVRHHGLLRSRRLYLHRTGEPDRDELTIEHNGLLIESGTEQQVLPALIQALVRRGADWDELYVDGIEESAWRGLTLLCRSHGLQARVRWLKPSHQVDLERVRQSGMEPLAFAGSNTRAQIRRSLRLYRERGELTLAAARDAGEALRFFENLATLHQRTWTGRGRPGAFASPYFRQFHAGLVRDGFARGEIQLLRASVGAEEVGYLYNFVHRGTVLNYQSGLAYQAAEDNRLKPGLVTHYLALCHNAERGAALYDFLAGAERYKESLATGRQELVWGLIQQPRLWTRLENGARGLWSRARSEA
jgi:CelD/BcsL family acetyltransferase involved in cellulose biosynthesis